MVARSAKSLAGFSSLFPARGELFCCLLGPVPTEFVTRALGALRLLRSSRVALTQPDAYGAGECRATASQLRRSKSVRMFNAGVEKVGALAETSDESELKNSTLLCSLRGRRVRVRRMPLFVVARSAKSLAGFSSLFPARGELFCLKYPLARNQKN